MKKTLLFCGLFLLLAVSANAQKVIKTQAFSVPAGDAHFFNYTFDKDTRLKGKFQATGGSKNDIQMLLLSEENFENWKNGNAYEHYYDTGRRTVHTFNLPLAKGSYVLVFNNKWSILTPKAVTLWYYE